MCDLEMKRLRDAVSYYRKLRKEGKNWIPKPNAKLCIYCAAHGVDPVTVIEGKQSLPLITTSTILLNPQQERFQAQLHHARSKKKLILESRPWLPTKGSEFRIWCEEHSIDIEELIDSGKDITDII